MVPSVGSGQNGLIGDEMAQIARREHGRFFQREGAVAKHALVFAIDRADRQVPVRILARQDHVSASSVNISVQSVKPLLVERRGVSAVEG